MKAQHYPQLGVGCWELTAHLLVLALHFLLLVKMAEGVTAWTALLLWRLFAKLHVHVLEANRAIKVQIAASASVSHHSSSIC
jgi:hypothetical protein